MTVTPCPYQSVVTFVAVHKTDQGENVGSGTKTIDSPDDSGTVGACRLLGQAHLALARIKTGQKQRGSSQMLSFLCTQPGHQGPGNQGTRRPFGTSGPKETRDGGTGGLGDSPSPRLLCSPSPLLPISPSRLNPVNMRLQTLGGGVRGDVNFGVWHHSSKSDRASYLQPRGGTAGRRLYEPRQS